jgi:hypothetical protein
MPRIVTGRLLGDEFKNSGGRRKAFSGVAARTMFLTRILTAALFVHRTGGAVEEHDARIVDVPYVFAARRT